MGLIEGIELLGREGAEVDDGETDEFGAVDARKAVFFALVVELVVESGKFSPGCVGELE
jgi:hypothetical protein